MSNNLKFYIDGAWVDPLSPKSLDVINPATEEAVAQISLGSAADVDRAVKAARAAFPAFSRTSKDERIALLQRITEAYKTRYDDIAKAISMEMGAPASLAQKAQAAMGLAHATQMVTVLKDYEFEHLQGGAGARGQLHHGAEAERDRAAQRHHLRRGAARRRSTEGRVQPGQRRR